MEAIKNILIWGLISFFLIAQDLKAQDYNKAKDSLNYGQYLDKYWNYKQRLNRYFVKVGPGIGESVVSNIRNKNRSSQKGISYSDQTIDLAWYISILATEYALLKADNQPITSNLQELYYAIKAFDRLDACERKPPWYRKRDQLDGFFQRYDVILDSLPELLSVEGRNAYLKPNDLWGTRPPGMPTYVSGYDADPDGVNYYHASVSQDQIIHLLMAWALLQKCLPDSPLIFNDIKGNKMIFNFKAAAEEQLLRIFEYIKRDKVWILKDPDGKSVARGHNVLMYAYPIRKLALKTVGFNFDDTWSASFAAKKMWDLSRIPNWVNDYNSTMALILAALSDSWIDVLPIVRLNNTAYYISQCGKPWNRETLFLLLYQFYNNKTTKWHDKNKVLKQLGSAPEQGPYYWSQDSVVFPCCGKVPGKPSGAWSFPNKFRGTKKEQEGLGKYPSYGNFSGIDYLLLYNLFHLVEQPVKYIKAGY